MPKSDKNEIQRDALLRKLQDQACVLKNATLVKEHHQRLIETKERNHRKSDEMKRRLRDTRIKEKEQNAINNLADAHDRKDRATKIRLERQNAVKNVKESLREQNRKKKLEEILIKNRNEQERAVQCEKYEEKIRLIREVSDKTRRAIHQNRQSLKEKASSYVQSTRSNLLKVKNAKEELQREKNMNVRKQVVERFADLSRAKQENEKANALKAKLRRDSRIRSVGELRKQIESHNEEFINKVHAFKRNNKEQRESFLLTKKIQCQKKIRERRSNHDSVVDKLNKLRIDSFEKNRAIVSSVNSRLDNPGILRKSSHLNEEFVKQRSRSDHI